MLVSLSLVLLLSWGANLGNGAEGLFQEAVQAVQAEDFPTALGKFEAALEADPNNLRYGSEYRQAVLKVKEYDRCIAFFENLVEKHPEAGYGFLNLGFAHVDKIPDAGSITQVLLANTALSHFTRSIELEPSWIGYYTRGNSYLFWPKIFNRAQLGVDDLEKAVELQKSGPKKSHYVRAYLSLGDGYWKVENYERARVAWREGLEQFPDNEGLKARLSGEDDAVETLLGSDYDPNKRVNTDLREVWENE